MHDSNHKRLHMAIIMDGNGRWAAQRGLPRSAGHRAGISDQRPQPSRLEISSLTPGPMVELKLIFLM